MKKQLIFMTAVLSIFTLTGCSSANEQTATSSVKHFAKNEARYQLHKGIRRDIYKAQDKIKNGINRVKGNPNENKSGNYKSLANSNYKPGSNPVISVNHDKSTLTNKWKYSHIDYSNLDNMNRTGTATAYLSKKNLGRSEGRTAQTWNPTGWHNQPKTVNGRRVFPQNRGHLIAYTLTFNLDKNGKFKQGAQGSLDNPKNLATQSAFSNQKPMQQDSENLVRNALEKNEKVIYQVTPVFKGSNLMSTGYWVQAKSTNGKLNFNRFIYNVQPGIKFNFVNGTSKVDNSMTVPE